jgi:hypothetical protein
VPDLAVRAFSSQTIAPGQHRGLHRSHDLTGLRADHREAEDAVVGADKAMCGSRPEPTGKLPASLRSHPAMSRVRWT